MSQALTDLLEHVGIEAWSHEAWIGPALALAAALAVAASLRRERAIAWPAYAEARAAGLLRLDPLRGVSHLLRAGALAFALLVFAGPSGIDRAPPPPGDGLDLLLAVDTSDSMRALDTRVGGTWHTRLELAREVVTRFARQRAAEGDRVGLVVFGASALTLSPLTSDGALLADALSRVEAGMAGEATALGDALALSVKRVQGGGTRSGGRVVVLLTDGRHNAGELDPATAARLAHGAGVRVHTVAIGSAGAAVAMQPGGDTGSGGLQFERVDVDVPTLREVADATGGSFHAASHSGDLAAVYAEIDSLERVLRERPPRLVHRPRGEPLLAAAGVLLLCEILATRVVWRRLP